jgi:hypothetical protein
MQLLLGKEAALVLAILFFAFLVYSRLRRKRELEWIEERFGGEQPVIASFGITFFGSETDPGPVRKKRGFLLLYTHRIFFRSRAGLEWEVAADKVTGVDHGTSIKGHELNQSVMLVDYVNQEGRPDRAAFRVPYPPQWIRAIKTTHLGLEPPSPK